MYYNTTVVLYTTILVSDTIIYSIPYTVLYDLFLDVFMTQIKNDQQMWETRLCWLKFKFFCYVLL